MGGLLCLILLLFARKYKISQHKKQRHLSPIQPRSNNILLGDFTTNTLINPGYDPTNPLSINPGPIGPVPCPIDIQILDSKSIRRENIQVDVNDNSLDGRQSFMEIGRGHFAIVYKGEP